MYVEFMIMLIKLKEVLNIYIDNFSSCSYIHALVSLY